MIDFGGWLKNELKVQKVTMCELAEEIGHDRNIIRHWINNDGIRLDNAQDVLDYLGYDFEIVKRVEDE